MTWWHPHPDAAALVRKHWREAELLIVAQNPPCIKIRDDELANIDRVARAADERELKVWARRRHRSWMVAVLVCEGDDLGPLAATVRDLRLESDRFHFYLHKGVRVEILRPWAHAGLPLEAVDVDLQDWKELHKLLGLDFNVRSVEDFLESG